MKIPVGFDEIVAMYGKPGDPINLVKVTLPAPIGPLVKSVSVHPKIADAVRDAFQALFTGGHWNTLHDYGGCYCVRVKRGQHDKWSVHSWAAALDFNVAENPLGAIPPEKFDPEHPFVFTKDHPVIVAFKNQGAVWGGDFAGRKDSMHIQFAARY